MSASAIRFVQAGSIIDWHCSLDFTGPFKRFLCNLCYSFFSVLFYLVNRCLVLFCNIYLLSLFMVGKTGLLMVGSWSWRLWLEQISDFSVLLHGWAGSVFRGTVDLITVAIITNKKENKFSDYTYAGMQLSKPLKGLSLLRLFTYSWKYNFSNVALKN